MASPSRHRGSFLRTPLIEWLFASDSVVPPQAENRVGAFQTLVGEGRTMSGLAAFTAFHVLLRLVGIGAGFIAVFGFIGGRCLNFWMDDIFVVGNFDERYGIFVSVQEDYTWNCFGDYLAGGAGVLVARAVWKEDGGRMADDIRRDSDDGTLFQFLRANRTAL
jgi:hypothetical protein